MLSERDMKSRREVVLLKKKTFLVPLANFLGNRNASKRKIKMIKM